MLWYVVPLGVAMALSLLPVLAAVLLLLSPRPVPVGLAYLAGWTLGVLLLVSVFTVAARVLPRETGRMPPWTHSAEIALGVVLLVWGIVSFVRARGGRTPKTPSWAGMMQEIGPRRAAAFGLAMNVRPKNLTLVLAAGLAIGAGSLPALAAGLAIVVFTLVGVSTVAGLVLAYVFGSTRVRPRLEGLGVWLARNAGTVLWSSMLFVGALLIAIGTAHLVAGT